MQDTTLKMTLELEKLSIRDTGFLISVNTGEWQKHNNFSRGGFREGTGGDAPPFFGITCFFCSHFEESQTVLFEVELIINNAPIKICLPKYYRNMFNTHHLLFRRQYYILLTQHQL